MSDQAVTPERSQDDDQNVKEASISDDAHCPTPMQNASEELSENREPLDDHTVITQAAVETDEPCVSESAADCPSGGNLKEDVTPSGASVPGNNSASLSSSADDSVDLLSDPDGPVGAGQDMIGTSMPDMTMPILPAIRRLTQRVSSKDVQQIISKSRRPSRSSADSAEESGQSDNNSPSEEGGSKTRRARKSRSRSNSLDKRQKSDPLKDAQGTGRPSAGSSLPGNCSDQNQCDQERSACISDSSPCKAPSNRDQENKDRNPGSADVASEITALSGFIRPKKSFSGKASTSEQNKNGGTLSNSDRVSLDLEPSDCAGGTYDCNGGSAQDVFHDSAQKIKSDPNTARDKSALPNGVVSDITTDGDVPAKEELPEHGAQGVTNKNHSPVKKQHQTISRIKTCVPSSSESDFTPPPRQKRAYIRRKPYVKNQKRLSLNIDEKSGSQQLSNGAVEMTSKSRKRKSMGDSSQSKSKVTNEISKRVKKSARKSSEKPRPLKLAKSFLKPAVSRKVTTAPLDSKNHALISPNHREKGIEDFLSVPPKDTQAIFRESVGQASCTSPKARKSISPTKALSPSFLSGQARKSTSPSKYRSLDPLSPAGSKINRPITPARGKSKPPKSPASESKVNNKAKRGPRAKMSLSPNRISTITIQDFFKPLKTKSDESVTLTAKKSLSYDPKEPKSSSKVKLASGKTVTDQLENTGETSTVGKPASGTRRKSSQKMTARKSFDDGVPMNSRPKVTARKSGVVMNSGRKVTARKSGVVVRSEVLTTAMDVVDKTVSDMAASVSIVASDENTISLDDASKALSALQTDSSPEKRRFSESSDVENNPMPCGFASSKGLKTPKARKSFPRSKESSPAESAERWARSPVVTTNKSSGQAESGPVVLGTLSAMSSSAPMTFKMKELENALGIKRKLLGKLDAKTLDQIVLERAQECKGKTDASPASKPRRKRSILPEESHSISGDGASAASGSARKSGSSQASNRSQSSQASNRPESPQESAEVPATSIEVSTLTHDLGFDTNFASLLASQKILKKRRKRRMGQYSLPGKKKPIKKTDVQNRPKHPHNLKEVGALNEHGNQSVSDLKIKICASNENGHFTVQKATPSPSELSRSLCNNPANGAFTEIMDRTEGSVNSQSKDSQEKDVETRSEGSKCVNSNLIGPSQTEFLGIELKPRRRKRKYHKRNWASGRLPNLAKAAKERAKIIKVKKERGSIPGSSRTSETSIDFNSAQSTTVVDDSIVPSPRTGHKRKVDDDTASVVSMVTSIADSDVSSTISKGSRSSKRRKAASLENDAIPCLSPATTPLPIVTRNVYNSEPPNISPEKICGHSLLKPSPKRSRIDRSAVQVGAVAGDVKYKIEGARGLDGSQPSSSGRRRHDFEDHMKYKFHNTPNGITYPVTPPRTPEHGSLPSEDASIHSENVEAEEVKGADKGHDYIPLCCCKLNGASVTAAVSGQKQTLYCQALDSVNGKIVGCCNKVTKPQMVRPALKIPFLMVCELHRDRMKTHQCCPGCGQFCVEGKFMQCQTPKIESNKSPAVHHSFHQQCQIYKSNKFYCPHCAKESQQVQVYLDLKTVQLSTDDTRQPQPTGDSDKREGSVESLVPVASRTARMGGRRRHSNDGSFLEEDLTAGSSVVVPSTDQIISSKKLPLGPSRTELQHVLSILGGDRAKKLRAGAKNLFKACRVGDAEKAIVLLADGADPNQKYEDEGNQTPLHAVARSGYHLLMHMLLQAGANPHVIDNDLWTPLMFASQQGHMLVLQILVKAGALVEAKASDGMTSLHLAAQAGKVEAVKYLLQTGRVSVNITDDGGWTSLIWAAEHSHLEVVHYLLKMAANPNIQDNEGNTALHWAAYSGSVDIAEIFLNAGCDIEAVNALGDRPLHIAARQDHYHCVVLLLARGADIEARNNDNESPVGCCVDKDIPVWMALRVNKQLKSFATRKQQNQERLMHRDISYGREANPMPVVNIVDDENYPTDFLYVMDNVETAPMNVNSVITSLQHCKCKETCGSVFCECSHSSVRCWYEKDGKLVNGFSYSEPPLIFECNKACTCWSNCPNRVVQLGVTCRLQVFRTSGRGWGARTLLDIPQGTFVCEYVGELISDAEADSREDDSYLFDLDNKDTDTFCIDARRYGNVSRFINHLCNPNLVPVKVFVDHQDLRFPRICFFASRDINAYEELGFDYGEKFWIIKWKQFTCTCGSPKCRYSQETIHKTLEDYNRRQEEDDVGTDPPGS